MSDEDDIDEDDLVALAILECKPDLPPEIHAILHKLKQRRLH